jgi:hypothetical protein
MLFLSKLQSRREGQIEVENVEQFTYLGSIISTTGRTDEDIKARKRKAQQTFAMLKLVWRSCCYLPFSVCILSTSIVLILLLS